MTRLTKSLWATSALSIVIGGEWRIAAAIAIQAQRPSDLIIFDEATSNPVYYINKKGELREASA